MRLIDGNIQAMFITNFILERKEKIIDILQKRDNDYLFALMMNYFDEQPTAYDIDKVVDELEEWSFEAKILVPNNNELGEYEEEVKRKIICTQNAIEIVKQGGVSDDVCQWNGEQSRLVTFTRFTTACGDNIDLQTNSELLKAFRYCPFCGKKIKIVGD